MILPAGIGTPQTVETTDASALPFPVVTWLKLVKDHREALKTTLNSKTFSAKYYRVTLAQLSNLDRGTRELNYSLLSRARILHTKLSLTPVCIKIFTPHGWIYELIGTPPPPPNPAQWELTQKFSPQPKHGGD
jgi:hypothetical protein